MPRPAANSGFRAALSELGLAALGLIVLGFFYLRPASTELLRGNGATMIGDDSDSITNPWQYALVLDTLKHHPSHLLFGAIYTEQIGAPLGDAIYVPFIERILVLLFAPFLRADLMPTAIVWALLVLSGLSLYALGRLLGWPKLLAFALAIAIAFTPFARARASVHIVLVGVYWAPLSLVALTILARPPPLLAPKWRAPMLAALLLLVATFAAHYFVIMGAVLAPFFVAYYVLLLPKAAPRARSLGRLVGSAMPAILFVGLTAVLPVPPGKTLNAQGASSTREAANNYVHWYGAAPIDFITGDVKLDAPDPNPLRSALSRDVRDEAKLNLHERTNGVRWTLLFGAAALFPFLVVPKLRSRLTPMERRVGAFALAFGLVAFLLALRPQAITVFGVELGPSQLVARLVPRYRVPSRMGTVVNLASILATGTLFSALVRQRRRAERALALMPALMVLDYAPLGAVPLQPIEAARKDLEPGGGATCGAGVTLPYVSWGSPNADYYRVTALLRGTDCKLLHEGYLTDEDTRLMGVLGRPEDVVAHEDRAEALATCTHASYVLFRASVPRESRTRICDALGFTRIADDACRTRAPVESPASIASCLPAVTRGSR